MYCFVEQTNKVFADAFVRGMFAAAYDWPRSTKTPGDALEVASAMHSEVCCIAPEAEMDYQSIVCSAWLAGYRSLAAMTPREVIGMGLADIKKFPPDEALRLARQILTDKADARAVMDAAYAEYQVKRSAAGDLAGSA